MKQQLSANPKTPSPRKGNAPQAHQSDRSSALVQANSKRAARSRPDEQANLSSIPEASQAAITPPPVHTTTATTTPTAYQWKHTNATGATDPLSTPPKNRIEPLQFEREPSTPESVSRFFANFPWRKQNQSSFDTEGADGIGTGLSVFGNDSMEGVYYGDAMDDTPVHMSVSRDSGSVPSQYSSTANRIRARQQPNFFVRSLSFLTQASSKDPSLDSLADFDESEWTPQDSAYGAACPICGFVPKKLRRGIEVAMIGFLVFILVYLVITTSIRITNERINDNGNDASGSDYNKLADDDFYIENRQDDMYATDDAQAVDDLYAEGGDDDDYVNANAADDGVVNDDAAAYEYGDDAYADDANDDLNGRYLRLF